MKNTENILNLVSGNIKPEDKKEVLSDIQKKKDTKEAFNKVKVAWAMLSSTKKMPEYKVEKSYQEVHERIFANQGSKIIKYYSVLKYAAAIFIVLGIASLIFYLQNQSTLEIKYTSVVAENGQISKIILPDSSVVWLNSGTTLSYNNKYSINNRDLKLSGQAFFDIRRDKRNPLVVSCDEIKVKVLGTKFDVYSYPDDDKINVTLESGKVELSHVQKKSFRYYLLPGEMATYDNKLKNVVVKKIKADDYVGWRHGLLTFTDTPMKNVIQQLERKFAVEFKVGNPEVYNSVFNAKFKNENLIEILNYIQYSCPINYKIMGGNKISGSVIRLESRN